MSDGFDAAVELQITVPAAPVEGALAQLAAVAARGQDTPVGVPLLSVGLDASAGLSLPGIVAAAEHFGGSVTIDVHLDKRGTFLGGFLGVTGPDVHGPSAVTLALTPPLPGGGRIEKAGERLYRGAIGVDLGVVVVAGFASLDAGDPLSIAAVLSGTFRPPIQLSFGFTLVGVGGAIGINRRIDRAGLAAGLSSGELQGLLFPADPVGQAARVLPALDRSFPVSAGDFFAGPMLKLGWGTPTIMSATLAFIVGTDGVVIVGMLRMGLPCEDAPFALFTVTVLGVIDASGVSLDGSLVNSRIGPVTLDGDARFRLTSGPGGTMALSIGGFHPAFTPPPGMGGMRRLSAELSPLPFASMRLEGYAALTTDSAQLGGAVFLRADLAAASVDGQASFDAIILFSPFHFRADFRASLSLTVCGTRVAGVGITADFSGPGHWELNGSLTVEILWWDVDVDLHLAWGDPLPALPPATEDPVALVAQQLGLRENWSVAADEAMQRMVVVGDSIPGAAPPMSPLGTLRAVQSAAPLAHELARIGGRPLVAHVTVDVTGAGVAGPVTAGFPRGLFDDLTESDALGSGEMLIAKAGIEIGAGERLVVDPTPKVLDFEDAVLRPGGDAGGASFERLMRALVPRADEEFVHLVAAGAAARRRDVLESAAQAPRFVVTEVLDG